MRALCLALLAFAIGAAPAMAQKAHKYDANAEVTVTGIVIDYHESKARNDHPGLHFILEVTPPPPAPPAEAPAGSLEPVPPAMGVAEVTPEPPLAAEAETVEVHACPVRLLSQLDFPIEKGDELTVSGSRPGDGAVVIAREVRKGTVSLRLRDEKGVPIWTGLP